MNKNQKIPKLFFCENCHYSTYNNGDFIKHTTTRKHNLMIESDCLAIVGKEKKSDISSNYNCCYCKFTTHIKSNYDKHLLTEKHKKNVNGEPNESKYNCSQCSKEYLNYNALWKHKKHCVVITEREPEPLQNTFIPGNIITSELFMEVFRESKELQQVLIEQTKELQNQLLEQNNKLLEKDNILIEQNNKLIELASKQTKVLNH